MHIKNPLAEYLDHILAHTRGLWEELRGQGIFITGGTGFFGCWLRESFAWANDKLNLNASALVLSRNPEVFKKRRPISTTIRRYSFSKATYKISITRRAGFQT